MKLTIRGDELRRRRLEKFLSQQELASKADVSPQLISKLEVGEGQTIRPPTARAIARALGCKPQDITEIVAVAEATA